MLLLPDIEITATNLRSEETEMLNITLSMQKPFTLNGYIITDIIISEDRINIKIENGYLYNVNYTELHNLFLIQKNQFIINHGENACVFGRRDIYDWNTYTFAKYIREIMRQCDILNMSIDRHTINRYMNDIRNDLVAQGRTSNSYSVFTAPIAREGQNNNNLRYYTFANGNSISVTNPMVANVEFQREKEYIHSYNYKPTYVKHYMPDEDKDTLVLGAEIEVDEGGKSEIHAKKALGIMCGYNSKDEANEDKIYCMSDGSLRAGIEFATMPCSLEYHKNSMKYKEMFDYLVKNGYKAHDTTTCGLHIHADRKYLGKSELVQQLTISKILYILEKFNEEICVIARRRRTSTYSQFIGDGKDEKSVVELYGKYKNNSSKYVALNLKHSESIEFRCFKGTLKYETFILTLEFVKNIIDFAKAINIEEIELIKWEDLMNTFSDELKEYYNDRVQKENQKKEDRKTNIGNSHYVYNGLGYINTSALSSFDNPSFYRMITNNMNNNVVVTVERERDLLNEFNRTFLDSIDIDPSSLMDTPVEKSTEEKLKDKIKSLKKQIKNSNNFMEKKNLSKELNEVQKELKKEKKKNKLSKRNNNTNTTVSNTSPNRVVTNRLNNLRNRLDYLDSLIFG